MRQGEIVEAGSAHVVLATPAHPYTRDLIAAAPGRDWDFANFCAYQPVGVAKDLRRRFLFGSQHLFRLPYAQFLKWPI